MEINENTYICNVETYNTCNMDNSLPFRGTEIEQFLDYFQDDNQCYEYLAKAKWKGNMFRCRICGYSRYSKSKGSGRRCNSCGYSETPTANTKFHKLKFPIKTAFELLFIAGVQRKHINKKRFSENNNVTEKTVGRFLLKVRGVLEGLTERENLRIKPLNGAVHVNTFKILLLVNNRSSNRHSNAKIILAREIKEDNEDGRAYAELAGNLSRASVLGFFRTCISEEATITTDGRSTFRALKNYENSGYRFNNEPEATPSNILNKHFDDIKKWIIETKKPKPNRRSNYQDYLDEYHYLFNRGKKDDMFNDLLEKYVNENYTGFQK